MRDNVSIRPNKEKTHFTVTRVLEETVDRAQLEERVKRIEMELEGMAEQRELLEKNLKITKDALKGIVGTESHVGDLK